jgi:hypothetical protein
MPGLRIRAGPEAGAIVVHAVTGEVRIAEAIGADVPGAIAKDRRRSNSKN